ncbi:MAG: hypothetical protein H0U76_25840 [Ktedonobacteraceae bacterium]|nr:hypothetical protein [Ktedonobacteraceae bacterium]
MTEAQGLIASLMAQGMNYADIGKAIGRDASYIRQAIVPNAKGYIKPARPSLPALRQLNGMVVQGIRPERIEVPRRPSKSGGLANVRGGLIEEKAGGLRVQTKNEGFLMTQIRAAADKGQWVSMRMRFDKVTWGRGNEKERHANVQMYKNGYSAQALLDRVEKLAAEKNITPEEALKELLRKDAFSATTKKGGSAGMKTAGKVEQYEMETSDERFAA